MKENFLPKNGTLLFALTTSPTAITQFDQWEVYFESDFSKPKMQAGKLLKRPSSISVVKSTAIRLSQ